MKVRLFACLSVALLFQFPASAGDAPDALSEVNAKRAARGLPPFQYDPGLTQAAHAAASYRATYRLFGHTANDFAFVPAGTTAASAGCAAYPSEYGWLSCCTYEGYTRAGASYAFGSDGKRYMHLFVGHGYTSAAPPAKVDPKMAPPTPPVVYAAPCAASSQLKTRTVVRERVTIRERFESRTRFFGRCR